MRMLYNKIMILLLCLPIPAITFQNKTVHPLRETRVAGNTLSSLSRRAEAIPTSSDTVWTSVNNGLPYLSVTSLYAKNAIIYAGSYQGDGIYISKNMGASWETFNSGLWDNYYGPNNIKGFAANETNLFVASENNGLYRNECDYACWRRLTVDSYYLTINCLAVNGNNILISSMSRDGGVRLSKDNGNRFMNINNNSGLTNTGVQCFLFNGTNLYAGCSASDQGIVFLSTDNGTIWKRSDTGLPNTSIEKMVVKGRMLFAGLIDGKIYISTDQGATWQARNNGLPSVEGIYMTDMAVHESRVFVSYTGYMGFYPGVYVSADNGANWAYIGLKGKDVTSLCTNNGVLFAGTWKGIFKHTLADTLRDVSVWQNIALKPTSGQFSTSLTANVVTFAGHQAKIISACADSLVVRVPEHLVGNRMKKAWLDTTAREIEIVAQVVHSPGDSSEICRERVRFLPPRPLLYDQVTRANPPILQDIIRLPGPLGSKAFQFIGDSTDGMAAVRLLNTSLATPPLTLSGKIIAPDGELFEKTEVLTPGNLINIGNCNAGFQFPVSHDGVYLIIVEAADDDKSSPPPWSLGPFPAFYQIHLSGDAGLPRKRINGDPEPARAIRMDTYFNHPAPRDETLQNFSSGAGSFAETGLFKFANPVSVSLSPIAVLIPPDPNGYTFGFPPKRAAPPLVPGLLPGCQDPSVPLAQTPEALYPQVGSVIDLAQTPIPASAECPDSPPGIAAIMGSHDGHSVTLPFSETIKSLICDMGSGNEIVDGAGKDFRVVGTSGNYSIAVSNTPFAGTFMTVGSGTAATEFDIAQTGLFAARYILISGAAAIDAIESINFFADRVDPKIGALSDVSAATITMRQEKSTANKLNSYLELIGPDGSALGKNDSGFGDDTDPNHSDAALISIPLTRQGFHRFLGRGYDTQPDERSHGTLNARLETAGVFDPVEIVVSSSEEEKVVAQKKGTMNQGPRQRDSYLFQAQPGQSVNIVVNGISSGQTPALLDPLLELYNPEDMFIAANDDYAGRGKNSAIEITLPKNGRNGELPNPSTYRIVVCGMDQIGSATGVTGGTAHSRNAALGAYEVKVFTGKMTRITLPPLVSAIAPTMVTVGAVNVPLHIYGSNFSAGAVIAFSGSGITVRSITVVNEKQITVLIDVSATASAGKRSVMVTNNDGLAGTGQDLFEIRAGLGIARLKWDSPPAGGGVAPPANLALLFDAPQKSLSWKEALKHIKYRQNDRIDKPVWHGLPLIPNIIIDEIEPNNDANQAQCIYGDTVLSVKGRIGEMDDWDDVFKVTTTNVGIYLKLDGFASDCDLFIIDEATWAMVGYSDASSDDMPEEISLPDLNVGTFFIWVSNVGSESGGSEPTNYNLLAKGQFAGGVSDQLQSFNLYRSTIAHARATGNLLATVSATSLTFDDPVPNTGPFFYQITALYDAGESEPSNEVSWIVTVAENQKNLTPPENFDLFQNYPNPFNQSTTIQFYLAAPVDVKLQILNNLGQKVGEPVNRRMEAGYHRVSFNAMDMVSGVYFCRLQMGSLVKMKKLLLLK